MSSLLKKRFKSSKCKTLAKLTLSRIKLLKNKKLILVKQSRKDIAELLRTGQESNARIRVENVYREENGLAAYELIEQYCEVTVSRLSALESQKPCPPDMKEPIASLIYAAPRCADLPELQKLRDLFILKYGREFAVSASELRQDCGVSVQIIQSLSSHPPNGKTRVKLLKDVAAEHNITWDPSESVSESFKLSEDLIDGPSHFMSASDVPQTSSSAPTVAGRSAGDVPQTSSSAPTVAGRENQDSKFSHPVVAADHEGSSATAPPSEVYHKTYLSPYASRFQGLHSSNSGFSPSDRSNKVSNPSGKFPHSENQDSLPKDTRLFTRFEADSRTKSHDDNRAKLPETSRMMVDAKGEKILNHKNINNLNVQIDPHHGSPEADPYARAKAEGRMDYNKMSSKSPTNEVQHDSQPKEQYRSSSEEVQGERTGVSHNNQDGKLPTHVRPPSLIVTKSYSREGKDGGSPYPDVATAAQVAFESAALAAEAAKAAIDLVRMDSGTKSNTQTDEADSFERVHEAKSKLNIEKVAQAMRSIHVEMDSKQIKQRDECEETVHEKEDRTLQEGTSTSPEENGSPGRADSYSTSYQKQSELSKLHSATGLSNDAAGVQSQSKQNKIAREQRERMPPSKEENSFFDDLIGAQQPKINTGMQNLFSDDIFPQDLAEVIQQDESEKVFGPTWMHQSTSFQREQAEKGAMQKSPRFDDSESDKASDTDTPFYAKGRAADGNEGYGWSVSSLFVSKPENLNVFLKTGHSSPFIDHGSDIGENLTFDNQKLKMETDRDIEAEGLARHSHSVKPDFDSYEELYEEPTVLSSWRVSESMGHSHNEEKLKGSITNSKVSRGKSSSVSILAESDKYVKSDKAAYHRMKWHSSPSEEHSSPLQAGELSSEGDELYSLNVHSYNGNDLKAHEQEWLSGARDEGTVEKKTSHKLSWHSSASDEFENPSHSNELSPESDEFGVANLPLQNEHGQKQHKSDTFMGPQSNRSSETAKPYQAPKVLKGKPFYGESRRSVRSSRSQDRPDLHSVAASYESVNINLSSIFEGAHSEERIGKT